MTGISHILLAGLAAASVVEAQSAQRLCPDQWADPANDPCNPFRYIPSLPANAAFAALYFIVAIVLTWQNYRYRANYMLCLIIGAYCEGLGLCFRLMTRNDVHSSGKYIVMYLFVVLSPCAFLAADYILLGRIAGHLDGNRYLSPFKANWISWIFVLSDVATFLIQAAGGGLTISKDRKMADVGSKIFLAGIAIQAISFVAFTILWAMFAWRVRYQDDTLWRRPGWKPLHWALGFTCIWFIVRSIFRTIELSQGYRGYLATHEIYVLMLDTLPLLIGISVYMYWWPGRYLTPGSRIDNLDALQARDEDGLGGTAAGGEATSMPMVERDSGLIAPASPSKEDALLPSSR